MLGRSSVVNTKRIAFAVVSKQPFHSSAAALAKKHPKQVKKENLAKRAAKLAEFERTKPSFIVSKPTPFFNTLHTPASAYQQNSTGYQHFLTETDQKFLFEETPKKSVESSHMAAVDGLDEALKQEKTKVETLQKLLSLQNANAKAVQIFNIHQAIDWFKQKEGDTGSPEVQAAILTVRIHNLNSHLNQHHKDRHNYKQLRNMVHQRAKILKYLKSKNADRYFTCLEKLGLEPRAVEGEITL
ncbi:37S ribosomal protein S28, mitochondrial [Choanephora cucurbitarum]|uniref:37S ribosomal protein S28, mitochondrial n=1 Tax=Choanephora cucurbitarum TaxID=101091 RepID=A0A1C7NJI5_9FUNG|nr:37S ribosomal protein S28, mitochondrial [Choanephora cucurbitarum]